MSRAPRILVIRRENIGDLVCTTPLLRALRRQLPNAELVALVSGYSAAVLARNPDLDAVHAYTKAKHRGAEQSFFGVHAQRVRLILELRRKRFDWIVLPGGPHTSALRFARWIGGERLLVRGPEDAVAGRHEVEQTCHLLVRMGLAYEAPPARLEAEPLEVARVKERLGGLLVPGRRLVALHLSARKPSQRWPAGRFAELARALAASGDVGLMLLWAPGSAEDKRHPGDDDKAKEVLAALPGLPVAALATERLEELIAALALCDGAILGDGGAMHIAAALDKPLVCLFGQSDAAHWGPWAAPHEVLQKASREVADIAVAEVLAAWRGLQQRAPHGMALGAA